jgi:tRNA(Ile2)-agmatinylcytidine synthase
MVFRSNQGTNMHLQNELNLSEIRAYTAGYLRCKIITNPRIIQGGHVLFEVEDSKCFISQAAVYEPTGLTKIASRLKIGDVIEIGCGVRKATSKHPKTLNIEYIYVLKLIEVYDLYNPLCKSCKKRMKSEGSNKGFQCDRCQYKDSSAKKICIPQNRNINTGLYIPTPSSHRHLTKPIHRYGMEKRLSFNSELKLFSRWFSSSSSSSN